MKKLLLLGALVLVSLMSVSAVHIEHRTMLLSASLTALQGSATGSAFVRITEGVNPESVVRVTTQGLPYLGQTKVYEAWLVAGDYWQSMGVFPSSFSGQTALTYTIADDISFAELVVITEEPYIDVNPLPGKNVMIGELAQQTARSFRRMQPEPIYTTSEGSLRYKLYSLGVR